MKLDLERINFLNCEAEQIHMSGRVQDFGFLFGLNQDNFLVEFVSENEKKLIKKSCLGTSFFDLFQLSDLECDYIKNAFNDCELHSLRLPYILELKTSVLNKEYNKTLFSCVFYSSSGYFIAELEPKCDRTDELKVKHQCLISNRKSENDFKDCVSFERLCNQLLRGIKALTGYERTFIYKFRPDNSGVVVAEVKEANLESYHSVYFPEKDIPSQARELYKTNLVRMISDIDREPMLLKYKHSEKCIDLSQSLIRDLSPIHKKYLDNMGVKASMSISLLVDGQLWGLINCHHTNSHYIHQEVRLECVVLAESFCWQIKRFEQRQSELKKHRINMFLEKLEKQAQNMASPGAALQSLSEEAFELMGASGFSYRSQLDAINLGEMPSERELFNLGQQAANSASGQIVSQINSEQGEQNMLFGCLVSTCANDQKFMTGWFRTGGVVTQKWIGEPREERPLGDKKHRLKPRSEFVVVEKEVCDQLAPWSELEIYLAEKIHSIFLRSIVKEQEKVKRTISYLRAINNSKDEFLITLAHELKNPISALSAAVEVLSDGDVSNPAFGVMERGVQQISALVEDLLDVGKIIHGKVQLRSDTVELNSVVENAVELIMSEVRSRSHKLKCSRSENPIYVSGDFTRLTQIFVNLLNNAAKYTPDGGHIDVEVQEHQDKAEVRVKDDGIGISSKDLEGIFKIFSQVKNQESEGLGLGLALVEKLVHLHGGEIGVKSEGEGHGSEFYVCLPKLKNKNKKGP
ncbi:MAG: GAF domain-containing protein [Bacteriovoracaceae bacterium]|nr:GAF domain-containing protein [Bacteriovoracaceae bacterium]